MISDFTVTPKFFSTKLLTINTVNGILLDNEAIIQMQAINFVTCKNPSTTAFKMLSFNCTVNTVTENNDFRKTCLKKHTGLALLLNYLHICYYTIDRAVNI